MTTDTETLKKLLAEAHAENDENCRILGASAERELALLAQIDRLRADVAAERANGDALAEALEEAVPATDYRCRCSSCSALAAPRWHRSTERAMSDDLVRRADQVIRGNDKSTVILSQAEAVALLARIEALTAERDALKAGQIDAIRALDDAASLTPTPVAASQTPDPVINDPRVKQQAAYNSEAIKVLVEHLERWLDLASHCSIEDGVCCCGDNMDGHSHPMNCGHYPVDHGSYIAQHLVESTMAALRTLAGEEG